MTFGSEGAIAIAPIDATRLVVEDRRPRHAAVGRLEDAAHRARDVHRVMIARAARRTPGLGRPGRSGPMLRHCSRSNGSGVVPEDLTAGDAAAGWTAGAPWSPSCPVAHRPPVPDSAAPTRTAATNPHRFRSLALMGTSLKRAEFAAGDCMAGGKGEGGEERITWQLTTSPGSNWVPPKVVPCQLTGGARTTAPRAWPPASVPSPVAER